MPKLPKKAAKATAETESQSFDALPVGTYIGTLEQVTTHDGRAIASSPADVDQFGEGEKIPYWKWQFKDITGRSGEDVEPGKTYPGKLWVQTSLGENSRWKMKEVFDAFGYTTDTDTDEMCGEKVVLVVTQRTIEGGPRKGEIGNNVDNLLPYDESESEGDTF